MGNTIHADLTSTNLTANAVHIRPVRACPLGNIATRVRPTQKPAKGNIRVPFVTATASSDDDPTSFNTGGDATVDDVGMTVVHQVKKGHFSSPEGGLGLSTGAHLERSLINDFERDLWKLVTLQIVAGAYGAADVSVAAASYVAASLKTQIGACEGNPRTLCVAKAALLGLAGSIELGADGLWRYPGVDAGIYETELSTGDANVAILAGPSALAFHMENPDVYSLPPAEIKVTELVLPVLKIPAWKFEWRDRATRANWISIEGLFGAAPAEVAALSYAASP